MFIEVGEKPFANVNVVLFDLIVVLSDHLFFDIHSLFSLHVERETTTNEKKKKKTLVNKSEFGTRTHRRTISAVGDKIINERSDQRDASIEMIREKERQKKKKKRNLCGFESDQHEKTDEKNFLFPTRISLAEHRLNEKLLIYCQCRSSNPHCHSLK